MAEEQGEGVWVKSEVEVVEGGAGHGYGEVELVHGRGIGREHGNHVTPSDSERVE